MRDYCTHHYRTRVIPETSVETKARLDPPSVLMNIMFPEDKEKRRKALPLWSDKWESWRTAAYMVVKGVCERCQAKCGELDEKPWVTTWNR